MPAIPVTAGAAGRAEGEYRWMFGREGAKVRVAVLWSTGTLTASEHVFWLECDFEPFARHVRDEVARQNCWRGARYTQTVDTARFKRRLLEQERELLEDIQRLETEAREPLENEVAG